jgi:hypothetical protein
MYWTGQGNLTIQLSDEFTLMTCKEQLNLGCLWLNNTTFTKELFQDSFWPGKSFLTTILLYKHAIVEDSNDLSFSLDGITFG